MSNERSRLYSLKPIGIGTELVESLTSYIERLADQHSVLVRDLLKSEIEPLSGVRIYPTIFKDSYLINGHGIVASNLVEILSQLTKQTTLQYLTLIPARGILSNSRLLRKNKAWCPVCIKRFSEKQMFYEPLVWQLQEYKLCHIHNAPLQEECPKCGAVSSVLARAQPMRGCCTKCGNFLGKDYNEKSGLVSEKGIYKAYIIAKLLSTLPRIPPENLTRNGLSGLLTECFNQQPKGNYRNRLAMKIYLLHKSGTRPSLETVIDFAKKASIDPVEYLLRPIDDSCDNSNVKVTRRRWKRARINRKYDQSVIRDRLSEYLRAEVPLSLRKIAMQMGLSPQILRRYTPELVTQIVVRHKKWMFMKQVKLAETVPSKVEEAMEKIKSRGARLTRASIQHELFYKIRLLRDGPVREAFLKTMRLHGYID